jgi:hypothetical protein
MATKHSGIPCTSLQDNSLLTPPFAYFQRTNEAYLSTEEGCMGFVSACSAEIQILIHLRDQLLNLDSSAWTLSLDAGLTSKFWSLSSHYQPSPGQFAKFLKVFPCR